MEKKLPLWFDLLFFSGFVIAFIFLWLFIVILDILNSFTGIISYLRIYDSSGSIIFSIYGIFFVAFVIGGFSLWKNQIKKWILKNITCPRCKISFKEFEFTESLGFRGGIPADAFCDKCKGVYRIISQSIITRGKRGIEIFREPFIWRNEKNIKKEYMLSARAIFAPFLSKEFYYFMFFESIFIIIFTLIFHIPPNISSEMFFFFWVFPIIPLIITKTNKYILKLKCPICGNNFNRCRYRYTISSLLGFDVFCSNCNTKFILKTGLFDNVLEIKRAMQKVK